MRIALVTAAAAAFTVGGAGCSSSTHRQENSVYCIDGDNRVVSDRYCDDDGNGNRGGTGSSGYYLWHANGRHRYAQGSVVSGGERIGINDANARTRVGLPGKGPVASGTVSRGGIGNGSSGESSGG
jgi:hypothetical protein